MSKKVITRLIDDLDGGPAVQTETFVYHGVTYEIDLSKAHVREFEKALSRFADAGRRVRAGRTPTPAHRPTTMPPRSSTNGFAARGRMSKEQNRAVRDWAAKQGIELSGRGRIPGTVIDQFNAAHPS